MTAEELARSATDDQTMPDDLSPVARVLWLAKAGQWDQAHDDCQDLPDPGGAWIHAWLHRQEADFGNARYWYARAGKAAKPDRAPLDEEWLEIARGLMG